MNSTEYKALQLKRAKARDATIRYNPPFKLRDCWPATYRWIEHASDGLRVHRAPGRDNCWYVDNCGAETTTAHVLQLPAGRDGTLRYMAATSDPYNPDCYLTDGDLTENMKEAAQWASRLAEHYSEQCREDDAKFQAEQQIEQAKEDICGLREQHSRLVEELRRSRAILGDVPLLVNNARKGLRSLREDVAKAHKRIKQLSDNYWYAVQ